MAKTEDIGKLLSSISAFAKARDEGSVTIEEVTEFCLSRIESRDGSLGAFLTVNPNARNRARQLDNRRSESSRRSLFYGYPIAIKDNLNIEGLPTTCASRILANHRSIYTATAVSRLLSAGAVVLGKTNMDEFAMGSSTENSAMGITRNPWDHDRVPGGSSGGSAVAVAGGLAPMSLGSDTGGSIRQPAAFCGVLGLKPTYGRISRQGLVAFSSSLDQIGPFAQNPEDALHITVLLAGHDPLDMTTAERDPQEMVRDYEKPLKGKVIGIPDEFWGEGMDPQVRESLEKSRELLLKAGMIPKPVRLPSTRYAVNVYYLIATSEAASNLSRFDGIRYGERKSGVKDLRELYEKSRGEGFGPEVKRRILLGTFALSAGYQDQYYRKAQKVQSLIREEFLRAFSECDFLFAPVTPTPAFRFGEKISDPLSMYLSDIYTISANLAGLPALSAPSFPMEGGLPVGAQLIGPHWSEGVLLKAASVLHEGINPGLAPWKGGSR